MVLKTQCLIENEDKTITPQCPNPGFKTFCGVPVCLPHWHIIQKNNFGMLRLINNDALAWYPYLWHTRGFIVAPGEKKQFLAVPLEIEWQRNPL